MIGSVAIPAIVVTGLREASKTIDLQKPLMKPFFPEIERCQSGTINLNLALPLQVRLPDIVTDPLPWPQDRPGANERFGITRVELEFSENRRDSAWLYTAEQSPYRFNDFIAEIIAGHLPWVKPGVSCTLHIPRCRAHTILIV